jgi:hypothetical protein
MADRLLTTASPTFKALADEFDSRDGRSYTPVWVEFYERHREPDGFVSRTDLT